MGKALAFSVYFTALRLYRPDRHAALARFYKALRRGVGLDQNASLRVATPTCDCNKVIKLYDRNTYAPCTMCTM